MKITLWILQGLLALVFLAAGAMKLAMPIADVNDALSWTADLPTALVRLIGLAEVLGAVGLILPALTRIRPHLTVLAALGLALVMVGATVFHLLRGEYSAMLPTLVLGALLAFVAWGRTVRVPITPRTDASSTTSRASA